MRASQESHRRKDEDSGAAAWGVSSISDRGISSTGKGCSSGRGSCGGSEELEVVRFWKKYCSCCGFGGGGGTTFTGCCCIPFNERTEELDCTELFEELACFRELCEEAAVELFCTVLVVPAPVLD